MPGDDSFAGIKPRKSIRGAAVDPEAAAVKLSAAMGGSALPAEPVEPPSPTPRRVKKTAPRGVEAEEVGPTKPAAEKAQDVEPPPVARTMQQRPRGPMTGRRQQGKGAARQGVNFRCSGELRAKLEELAATWGVSLNAALARVLDEHGRETDEMRKRVLRALDGG